MTSTRTDEADRPPARRRGWASGRVRLGAALAVAVVALVVSGSVLLLGGDEGSGSGNGGVEVVEAWAAPSSTALAVYLGIDNGGPDDRLVGASSDIAGSASLMGSGAGLGHTSTGGAGVVDRAVPPGETELLPGESHLMFEGLTRALEPGDRFTVVLTFERTGPVTVEVDVLTWDEVATRAG